MSENIFLKGNLIRMTASQQLLINTISNGHIIKETIVVEGIPSDSQTEWVGTDRQAGTVYEPRTVQIVLSHDSFPYGEYDKISDIPQEVVSFHTI